MSMDFSYEFNLSSPGIDFDRNLRAVLDFVLGIVFPEHLVDFEAVIEFGASHVLNISKLHTI
jgi:hypothetical protein